MQTASSSTMEVSPAARLLSPRRKTTEATTTAALAAEQLAHFHIDPISPVGVPLLGLAERLYRATDDLPELWEVTLREPCRFVEHGAPHPPCFSYGVRRAGNGL